MVKILCGLPRVVSLPTLAQGTRLAYRLGGGGNYGISGYPGKGVRDFQPHGGLPSSRISGSRINFDFCRLADHK